MLSKAYELANRVSLKRLNSFFLLHRSAGPVVCRLCRSKKAGQIAMIWPALLSCHCLAHHAELVKLRTLPIRRRWASVPLRRAC